MIKISVVVTTKNEEKRIGELLQSLLHQEPPCEVVVVDAESTDKTQQIVQQYIQQNPNIKLFIKSGIRPVGMNYGIQQATGDAVAFIGGDDIADKNWIKEIRKAIKNADIVVGTLISKDEERFKTLANVKVFHKGENIAIPGTNTTYQKHILDEIQGFDPHFFSAEDLELNYRAIDKGYKITKHDPAIVYYRPRSSLYDFLRQSFWYGTGRKLLGLKHGRLWKQYSVQDVVKTQFSVLGIVRLAFGLLGYIYCEFITRNYPEKYYKNK